MSLITAETASRVVLGMSARCTFIKRAAWANEGQTLAVAHGSGLSVWMGGFDSRPDHVFATEAPMRAIAASPVGPVVATAQHDGRIRLWNSETWVRDRAMPIQPHHGAVSAISFHPTRWIIVSGDSNGYAVQVDLDSGRFMKLAGHSKEISRIAFSPDASQIVTGSWDGTARLFSARTGALLHVLEHGAWVRWATFSADGQRVATACTDGVLRLWNTVDGALAAETLAHDGGFDTLALSPDGTVLATGGRDGTLRLWDAATLAPLAECVGAHEKPVLTLVFRPQGDFLVSGGGDNWLHLWELAETTGAD